MARLVDIAETVLQSLGRPASVKEIIDFAQRDPKLKNHIRGLTPHKTLNARISTDIVSQRERSSFYRFAPSVFGLRRERDTGKYAEYLRKTYIGNRRRKVFSHLYVATVEKSSNSLFSMNGFIPSSIIPLYITRHLQIIFRDRNDGKLPLDRYGLKIYYYVSRGDLIVKYEKSEFDESRVGSNSLQSVCFGSWITEKDISLFSESFIDFRGAVLSDFSDLFSSTHNNPTQYINDISFEGFIIDRTHRDNKNSLIAMFGVNLKDEIDFEGRLGVKNLQWVSCISKPNYVGSLETISQYLLAYIAEKDSKF